MPITTGSIPKSLVPGVKAWFGRYYDQHPVEYTDLFDMDMSTRNFEEDVEVTGFGLAPEKTEGGVISYDTESQGYISRLIHAAYALGFIVTREEIDDNLYEKVGKTRSQALAFSMRQTKEVIAAQVYNRAFNSSYTGGDGVELCATTHPSLSGNWQNELTNGADLSEAAIEDMCILIMKAVNSKGLAAQLMPRALIIPPDLKFEADRILNSALQNDTANNAINAVKGIFPEGVKVNHYLDDPDAWFIRTNCPRGMIGYDRKIMDIEQDNDFDTYNARFKKYERYSFGWTDPRGIYGSPGA